MLLSRRGLALPLGHSHPSAYGKQFRCRQYKGRFKRQVLPTPDLSLSAKASRSGSLSLSSPLFFPPPPPLCVCVSTFRPSPIPFISNKLHTHALSAQYSVTRVVWAQPTMDTAKVPFALSLTSAS